VQRSAEIMRSGLAEFAMLSGLLLAPALVFSQASDEATPVPTPRPSLPAKIYPPKIASPRIPAQPSNESCGERQPPVTISVPAPAPAPWAVHDRISWAANLVLVVLGYAGIMLAISTMKKIERQTRAAESAASAAADQAHAAMLNVEAIIRSERPWILVSVELALDNENSFTVVAANRGRVPARFVSTSEHTSIVVDESHLPRDPKYGEKEADLPFSPTILLPGESTPIRTFSRRDLERTCGSEEIMRRVKRWEEKIFIYGRISYRDLIERPAEQPYETSWCCWYIHGRNKSGLIIAGPPQYNSHS
jgi:hypothetical protein